MIKINKQQARELFNKGIDFYIGGHDIYGEGAKWKVSRFKQDTFENLCDYFKRYYCKGVGRFLKVEFYKIN